jgi:hypothetical protein
MISEITFSKRFTSFWNQLLPNERHYVRLINDGLFEVVDPPTGDKNRKENIALINEASFEIYKEILNKIINIHQLHTTEFYNSKIFSDLTLKVMERLSKFAYGSKFTLPLVSNEKETIKKLTLRLHSKYPSHLANIRIPPFFPGCGYINSAHGDLHINAKLIEIKSGARNFSVVDMRQVLTYCTLNFYSKTPLPIDTIELYNPRMGICYSSEINKLCNDLGSLDQEELFFEIKQRITDDSFIESIDW